MDNLIFEFVPERSTFLLTALGVAMLWAVVKRRRT
ncbi:MAG: PEP-CTERM sorting domain-containing protein [Verrucomicrobiia bacterium]